MLFVLLLIGISYSAIYDTNVYTLGSNLVVNPSFTSPDLNGSRYIMTTSVPGWRCTPKCQINNIAQSCALQYLICENNYTQTVDMDSDLSFDQLRQNILIVQQGSYLLTIIWLAPLKNPIGKKMHVQLNGTRVLDITCNASATNYKFQKEQILVDLTLGNIEIFLQMSGVKDYYGFFLSGVFLQRLVPIEIPETNNHVTATGLEKAISNEIVTSLNKLPGNRIFLRALTDHMITFDRLRFYYFHRQNLTYYSNILLSNVNTFGLDQGSLCQDIFQSCTAEACNSINNLFDNLLSSLNYKERYTDSFIINRNSNGLGFFANNLDFFFYQLPFILLTYFLFALAFKLLFNYRISKHIRKYAFYGIVLLIVYEGSVEQLTFFFFCQCRNFFSSTFSHKIANIFMIYFFFLTILFSVGGLFFFYYHYRRLAKYFLDDSKGSSLEAAVIESLQRSVYPLIFGSIHALLLDSLGIQSIILGVTEMAYLSTRFYALRSITPHSKFKVGLLLTSSLLRMGFIFSFYLYQTKGYPEIINNVHFDMVWLYVICWILEFFSDFADLILQLFNTAKRCLCSKNKAELSQNFISRRGISLKKLQKEDAQKEEKRRQQKTDNGFVKYVTQRNKEVNRRVLQLEKEQRQNIKAGLKQPTHQIKIKKEKDIKAKLVTFKAQTKENPLLADQLKIIEILKTSKKE